MLLTKNIYTPRKSERNVMSNVFELLNNTIKPIPFYVRSVRMNYKLRYMEVYTCHSFIFYATRIYKVRIDNHYYKRNFTRLKVLTMIAETHHCVL